MTGISGAQTGPYTAKIAKLQTKSIGSAYNTVFLNLNIIDSPCTSTNSGNRLTIINNEQHSTVLAAVMANKDVTIYGTGICNSANIDQISAIIIEP